MIAMMCRFLFAALALLLFVQVTCLSVKPPIRTYCCNGKVGLPPKESQEDKNNSDTRRSLLSTFLTSATATLFSKDEPAQAAPPIAIIAEELGYFPVTIKEGNTVYIPKKVSRKSSPQAIELAKYLSKSKVIMYGAYWCPHCARQKELFGKEAWSMIDYVECAPRGYGAQVKLCKHVQGFPEWSRNNKLLASGEVSLSTLASKTGYPGTIDDSLEQDIPPLVGGSACK